MISIATSIAHHHPHFPPPSMTRSDGSVFYHLRGASFVVKVDPDGFRATLKGGANLARPTVEAIAATPEAAIAAVIRDGEHIIVAAAVAAANQASVLAAILGDNLPPELIAAQTVTLHFTASHWRVSYPGNRARFMRGQTLAEALGTLADYRAEGMRVTLSDRAAAEITHHRLRPSDITQASAETLRALAVSLATGDNPHLRSPTP